MVLGIINLLISFIGLLTSNGAKISSGNIQSNSLWINRGLSLRIFFLKSTIRFGGNYAFYIFIIAGVLYAVSFVPGLRFCTKGACRWVDAGPITFQPAEIYKIAFVMYTAAWFASVKQKVSTFKLGTLPFLILIAISGGLVLAQPDTDTFMVIAASGLAILLPRGRWRDMIIMGLIGAILLAGLVATRPYLKQRIMTFMDPSKDPTGSGYQIQQSLIAVGSGGIFGRGFGQSIQKFNFLPEPIGDSIFAVAAEEFSLSVQVLSFYCIYFLHYKDTVSLGASTRSVWNISRGWNYYTHNHPVVLEYLSNARYHTAFRGHLLLYFSWRYRTVFALSSVGIVLEVSEVKIKKGNKI